MAIKSRKPRGIKGVKLRLWRVIMNAEDSMFKALDANDTETAMRAAGVTVNAVGK